MRIYIAKANVPTVGWDGGLYTRIDLKRHGKAIHVYVPSSDRLAKVAEGDELHIVHRPRTRA